VNKPNGRLLGRHGRLRRISILAVAAVVTTGLAPGARSAVVDGGEQAAPAPFTRLDVRSGGLAGTFRPASLVGDRRATVILQLDGASVGRRAADARKQGKQLSAAQKASIRAELKGRQQALERRVRALGGQALFDYQDAYNGVAARVALKDLAAVSRLPGVAAIHPTRTFQPDNTVGVQYIGANTAWADTGFTGQGVRVGVLDTGVDYYHANFGGTDGAAKFAADDSTVIEPGSFPTAKVAAGTDFVGDDYDDSSDDPALNTPRPDPDPLDCNGHGSHVAGSAAGFGVLDSGVTYPGPYDATTYGNAFRVGPGVAPQATVHAYRVFGCEGSTSEAVIVAALNRAMVDGVDVVNMSLGSPFGRTDEPSSAASDMLAENGIVVVASAGNEGAGAYITGAPAAATRALSVAALDASSPTFPGADLALSTGQTIPAQLSNGPFQNDPGASLPSGPLAVAVLRDSYPDGPVSLGCDAADFAGYPGGVSGKFVVVLRGVCARVHKAIVGQKAGAAAVAMIDTSAGFPPFEGQVTSDPDTGEQFTLTIPFFGVRGVLGASPTDDPDKLVAADGGTSDFTASTVANPTYQRAASFTSGGPRNPDSGLKPEVIAPGVSVKSTASGTGDAGTRISGTSMAAPHTAGLAALVTQAHPAWSTEAIKAAIIGTTEAGTSKIQGYNLRTAGAGVIMARRAVDTAAYATTHGGSGTLSFGYQALGAASSQTLPVTLHNTGAAAITYDLSVAANLGQLGAAVTTPSQVTVPAGGTATFDVTASLTAAAAAALPPAIASNFGGLNTVKGAVVATPTSSGPGIYPLRVPYLLAPRGLSNVTAGQKSPYTGSGNTLTATVPLANGGIHAGTADVYAWGIRDANDTVGGEDSLDVRDAGVQVQPRSFLCGSAPAGACGTADDRSLVFAVNMYGRWSNPSVNEVDIAIDLQSDRRADFFVVGVDLGAVLAGEFNGQFASFIFDATGNLIDAWVASAPMNGSTMLLPTLASEIGLDPAVNSTRFNYSVASFSIVPEGLVDVTRTGTFRSHQPPVSSGQQVALNPGQTGSVTVTVDRGKFPSAPQLGWLVATLDDANGAAQADEVPIGSIAS
jgi:minor extracellular serine protease Vpr